MTTGIYKLNFGNNEAFYIGQSLNIEQRYKSHCTSMRCGTSTKKLNSAFKSYGLPTLEILLECEEFELDSNETAAIEVFCADTLGLNTMSSHGHRSNLRGQSAGNAKYSNEIIEEAFNYLVFTDKTHKEIQEILGMSRGALADISSGAAHTWLKDKFPEEYSLLEAKKLNRRKTSIIKSKGGAKVMDKYPLLESPSGEVFQVTLLREFCRQHDLNHGSIGQVLRGKKQAYKGWKLFTE